ncbi:TonB family protein [Pseudopedobacter saltans DSM 12145]|uniref:TonB family protein n=1 Tax=Pseudopedobacter saltans (strain ATCC 51119 / DSM 12145 / JCM 21818 / CCUG 39354 / LMG 10337 / NBRC 100064 / NCIMB 13643) TaxID=762903 RepID=F0SEK9_PSESL|nr:energy transducer TonB [Pseudopedobacter saltans]ADY51899.1 TonB family protein [Pseudopedobacter saltans DSM 12145]
MSFSKLNLNKGEWLDLVFQNRNKSYGAYEIRRDADTYLLKALLISFGVFSLFIGSTVYYMNKDKQAATSYTTSLHKDFDDERIVKLEDFKQETPPMVENTKPLPDQVASTPQINIAQIKYVKMRPVEDSKGVDAPATAIIKDNIIGSTDIEGAKSEAENLSVGVINGRNEISGNGSESDNTTYNTASVEQMPAFPGGMEAWAKFLRKNLNYPALAKEAGIQGRVTVSFVVEKDGSVTDVKVLRGIGGGCDEEAVRVIRKSPVWQAGVMNGRKVRVSYVIPVMFHLDL